jgi:hypothetical protein
MIDEPIGEGAAGSFDGESVRGDHVGGRAGTRSDLAILREVVTIYRDLSSLAARGVDLAEVVELVARRLDRLVWLVGAAQDVVIAARPGLSVEEALALMRKRTMQLRWENVLKTARRTRLTIRSPDAADGTWVLTAPVIVDDEVIAYLMLVDDEDDRAAEERSILVLEHAAHIAGMALGRERVVGAAASSIREDLLEGLLFGRATGPEELARWARYLGYDATCLHRVAVIDMQRPIPSQLPEVVKHFCKSRSTLAIVSVREECVVGLFPEPDFGHKSHEASCTHMIAKECLAYCQELFPSATLTVGLSCSFREPPEIASAYAQASRTVDAARRLGRHHEVIAFETLGVHRLLLQVPNLDELQEFANSVLGPFREREQSTDAPLLQTLRSYFHEYGNRRRMAARLHVHPHTVDYRLKRIEEIGDFDLHAYRDRLQVEVALEIDEVLAGGDFA